MQTLGPLSAQDALFLVSRGWFVGKLNVTPRYHVFGGSVSSNGPRDVSHGPFACVTIDSISYDFYILRLNSTDKSKVAQ